MSQSSNLPLHFFSKTSVQHGLGLETHYTCWVLGTGALISRKSFCQWLAKRDVKVIEELLFIFLTAILMVNIWLHLWLGEGWWNLYQPSPFKSRDCAASKPDVLRCYIVTTSCYLCCHYLHGHKTLHANKSNACFKGTVWLLGVLSFLGGCPGKQRRHQEVTAPSQPSKCLIHNPPIKNTT